MNYQNQTLFQKKKRRWHPHYATNEGFKGNCMVLSSLHGGLLTVHLNDKNIHWKIYSILNLLPSRSDGLYIYLNGFTVLPFYQCISNKITESFILKAQIVDIQQWLKLDTVQITKELIAYNLRPISLQSNVVDLRYFKLSILLDHIV